MRFESQSNFQTQVYPLFFPGPDFFDRLARETLGAFWRLEAATISSWKSGRQLSMAATG
jgi:hypothetical protein